MSQITIIVMDMGNLFLKERERWWIWLIWSALGGLLSGYILSLTKQQLLGFVVPCLLVLSIAIWMNYMKRFEFFRAFKILFLVVSVSFTPLLLNALIPANEVAITVVKGSVLFVSGLLLSLICAWFAKRPKQYY
ncbi:hypothetical protein PSECIP111951_02251 [Pseudoalteromonas holothuriae]|uniref:Uncharacterized protein n=1 Tax=Pseudoalteromonas holothuriae TaxID=2963714 RepID=A0A9W4QZQ4_9GAMM|nr:MULTISPECIES: hypothetical protein [unclassified Pseudoalteromonas]CAH9060301.1 hypothetical protein PSECIP111951_02251 [Pseudoalteromonas sp. CIP111951]CAH9060473.1 hypothetical protein PSECIP111854_02611 [Pseudoalteromonas sp. CIP111854]